MLKSINYNNNNTSLCILAFHIVKDELSTNQENILKELSMYFEKILCIHDADNITTLKTKFDYNNVEFHYCINNNYLDFGKYYYILKNLKMDRQLQTLALINDSCFLCHSMDFLRQKINSDVFGITDSIETNYHIQSYCLLFNNAKSVNNAILFFKEFDENILGKSFSKSQLINAWEISISQFLIERNMTFDVMFRYNDPLFKNRYNNISYFCPMILCLYKCPLIKITNFSNYIPPLISNKKIL